MASILVVEDNSVTRRLVRFTLEQKGYAVVDAVNGKAALEVLESLVPDLVLQDLGLPDMDGFELAAKLRKRLTSPRVPILAFSGFVSRLEEARIASVGFDDVIVKPVEPSRLLEVVAARLSQKAADAHDQFGRGRALIVAEDNPLQARLLAFRLRRLGFTVVIAEDGAQALAEARARIPDAIVADIQMPKLDGFQLCMEARRDAGLRQVPILLMTSTYVDQADRKLGEAAGATAYVIRTPDLEEVILGLRRALDPHATLASQPNDERDDVAVAETHARRVHAQLAREAVLSVGSSRRCAVLAAELAILGGISRALAGSGDLETALDEVLSTLFDAAGVSTGALLVFEGPGAGVRSVGTRDLWTTAQLESFFGDLEELRGCLATGAAVTLPQADGGMPHAQQALDAAGLGSALVAPLLCQGQLVGGLFLTSRQPSIGEEERIAFAVSAGAQIAQGIGLARAFAAQTAAMRRAQESEATLRSIMQSTADGIIVADEERRFLYWNPAAESLLKMGSAEIASDARAQQYDLFLPDRTMPFPVEELPLARAIRGESVRRVEVFARSPAEPKGAWLSVSAQPLLGIEGKRRGAVAVVRDVSTEKASQEQLMISDRMASVGMLAAGLAHEINNPLAAVMGNLYLAGRRVAAVEEGAGPSRALSELRDELDNASKGAERIRLIVRDLKLFSRSDQETTGPVDVQRVMESTLRMAWNEIRHRGQIIRNYETTAPAEASESRLGQVFLNLVVNAAQAIEEGQAEHNEIRIAIKTGENGHIVIEIADTGRGMSADVLGQLFTPFFTTKPVGVGTGLGLSICQRIVTGFGGSLGVESEPGKGTLFRVSLPPARSTNAAATPVPIVSVPARRRGKVLIVDDEPMFGEMLQHTLSPEHDVVRLSSADAALERILAGERFDVILCDLMMPQKTGMELHAELLREKPEQAANMIFMTGGAFTARAQAFLEETPNLRLEKPFDPLQLRVLVNERVR